MILSVIFKYNKSEINAKLFIISDKEWFYNFKIVILSITNLKLLQLQDEAPQQHRDFA